MSTSSTGVISSPGASRTTTAPKLLAAIGLSIWRALEREGRRRAARELQAVAARWEATDPTVARSLREARLNLTNP